MTPQLKRIAVALLVLKKFRDALEENNNVYHGGLVPNLTSIQDVLTLPQDILEQQLQSYPELVPTDEQLKGLLNAHFGKFAGDLNG